MSMRRRKLETSEEKANELLLESANLGHVLANMELAGMHGFEKNPDEAYFRASVAFALDGTNEQAAFVLGGFHYDKYVHESSLYLACYYTNIVASEDKSGYACHLYSKSLLRLSRHLHGGYVINGSNGMPAIFFWCRKSLDLGCDDTRETLKHLETTGQSLCANCAKETETGEKYKQCSKCRAQWYCSKECQVESWRTGHKKDCKRAALLKFEDYLNAK
ncbi:hypothetical protein THAOC_16742 [Thalassiosira oceanica]|uniref:MYND-type domain-containing protein n=1 Tax=Thalassiosira oceanica TaxID=159749 RepID=K0SBG0_THAOC|nr:hypothetical protein THAOC_16742 [Thalassiosira oceanica]|eukprot:EJK62635.1 hypothetical protein THAOC_16742 [Thalassiosira oceanica]